MSVSATSNETVLVVGSTGNIGVSAVTAALRSGRQVLAVVRSQASADKLLRNIGGGISASTAAERIIFAEADITSPTGVRGVVDRVRAGELPAFQHVYTCSGGDYVPTKLEDITFEMLRDNMTRGFEANFYAYRDTIAYLRETAASKATFTVCTGAQGEWGHYAVPAMNQGALFSMCQAASVDNQAPEAVRFNEVFLYLRVEHDADAAAHGVTPASDYARVYERLLAAPEIRSARVTVQTEKDFDTLRWASRV